MSSYEKGKERKEGAEKVRERGRSCKGKEREINVFILYSTSTLYEKGRERKEEGKGDRGNEKDLSVIAATQLTLSVTRCVQL